MHSGNEHNIENQLYLTFLKTNLSASLVKRESQKPVLLQVSDLPRSELRSPDNNKTAVSVQGVWLMSSRTARNPWSFSSLNLDKELLELWLMKHLPQTTCKGIITQKDLYKEFLIFSKYFISHGHSRPRQSLAQPLIH